MVRNKWKKWLLPAVLLSSLSSQAELKIVVINAEQAILQSEEGKAKIEAIRTAVEADELKIQSLSDQIKSLQEQLAKDAEVISDGEKQKLQKDIENLNIDAQFELQKYQKKGNELQQDLMREMTPKLQAVLQDLIEVEGYDLVMPRAGLLYTNAKHNITRKVTEKLNEKQ
ncbi:MAG: OmpH family outer membrane protein [Pseudomonadales bacterium]|jgi:outer membrane protein|nr:OmpH family outer membrane protein [Pseudomonadales bacterium]